MKFNVQAIESAVLAPKIHKSVARAALAFTLGAVVSGAMAMGNHPEAKLCSSERPYYAVCTSGSHDLQGWVGPCHATREDAEKDAVEHAQKAHGGTMHWTGVARTSGTGSYSENRGLPP